MNYDGTILGTTAASIFTATQVTCLPSEQSLVHCADAICQAVRARQEKMDDFRRQQRVREEAAASLTRFAYQLTQHSVPEDQAIGEVLNDRLFDLL